MDDIVETNHPEKCTGRRMPENRVLYRLRVSPPSTGIAATLTHHPHSSVGVPSGLFQQHIDLLLDPLLVVWRVGVCRFLVHQAAQVGQLEGRALWDWIRRLNDMLTWSTKSKSWLIS